MGNRIADGAPSLPIGADKIEPRFDSLQRNASIEPLERVLDSPAVNSKLFETSSNARLLRQSIESRFVRGASPAATKGDLEQKAGKLSELFSGGGKRTFESVAPHLRGLSETDAKRLRMIYEQKTGRDLLKDAANYLFMEDCFRAYRTLAPERIHEQSQPQAIGTGGKGIKMNPPTREILDGSQVEYALNLPGEAGGNRQVSHLIRREYGHVEEEGANFTGDYSRGYETDRNYRVTFQVRYGGDAPEFYTYGLTVKSATAKASNELANLPGTATDPDLYLEYLDGQIEDVRQGIAELEAHRDGIKADIQNDVGNSSDKYDELRRDEKQLETLRAKLPEMESARAEVSKAFANGSASKPIPLKAVLIAKENGQTIPLQLYAKQLGGNKWAIVDVTNPSKPRTWTGEGSLPADALNQAWNNFVGGTNDLPAGQIAAAQPDGLGFQANKNWNSQSSGQSTLKQWSNGLGVGSIALAVLGGAALFGPGTQPLAVPLLLGAGVTGGASAGANLADRVNNGTFEWKSSETALDMLGIAGGIASLGGLGAMTGAGKFIAVNGAKFAVKNLGSFTRIAQIAEQGTNVAGGILIGNQYVEAIDKVNRGPMSAEQKAAATRDILIQAASVGGLMVLGVGVSSKLAKAARASNWNQIEGSIGRQVKPGDPLPEGYHWRDEQIYRNPNKVEANFTPLMIENGKITVREGVERLSNPAVMRNNFKAKTEAEMSARGLRGEALHRGVESEMSRVQIHHIVPDELVQSTELGRAAQKAGYNLDDAANLKGMPRKPGDRFGDLDIEHRGSHPQYTEAVRREITNATETLKTKYKTESLDAVPADVIKKEMRRIENEFRQRLQDNSVPLKDGRLAMTIPVQRAGNGNYEIRA